jgi:hypothetical protein
MRARLLALQITTVEERHQEAAEAAAEQKAAAGAGKKRKGRGAAAAEPAKKGKIDMEALTQVGAGAQWFMSITVCNQSGCLERVAVLGMSQDSQWQQR